MCYVYRIIYSYTTTTINIINMLGLSNNILRLCIISIFDYIDNTS